MGLKLRNTVKGSSVSLTLGGQLVEVIAGKDVAVPEGLKQVDLAAIAARHRNLEIIGDAGEKYAPVSTPGVDPRVLTKHPSLITPSEGRELTAALEAADPLTHSKQTVVTPPDFVDRPNVFVGAVGGPDASDLVAAGKLSVADVEKALEPGQGTGSDGKPVSGSNINPTVDLGGGAKLVPGPAATDPAEVNPNSPTDAGGAENLATGDKVEPTVGGTSSPGATSESATSGSGEGNQEESLESKTKEQLRQVIDDEQLGDQPPSDATKAELIKFIEDARKE